MKREFGHFIDVMCREKKYSRKWITLHQEYTSNLLDTREEVSGWLEDATKLMEGLYTRSGVGTTCGKWYGYLVLKNNNR